MASNGMLCTCRDHKHDPIPPIEAGLRAGCLDCDCTFDDAMLLLAPGDPLRDTPAKCRAYAAKIKLLMARNDADAAAALEVLQAPPPEGRGDDDKCHCNGLRGNEWAHRA